MESPFKIARFGRSVALGATFALVLTFLSYVPPALAQAASATHHAVKSVPGAPIAKPKKRPAAGKPSTTPPVAMPPAATYQVSAPTAATSRTIKTRGAEGTTPGVVDGPWQSLGTTGIAVAAARAEAATSKTTEDSTAAPSTEQQISARVLSSSEKAKLGVSGLAIELTRTGSPESAPVALQIPEKYLTGAYGANYASRISWQEEDVDNSAPVANSMEPVAASTDATSTVLTPSLATSSVVVAAVTSPASSTGTGDFAATPLDPAGSWGVSAQTGDFSWNFPMQIPPAAAGPSPTSLGLKYDSQAVDGNTGGTNNQSSSVGIGWSLAGGGNIQRQYVTCSQAATAVSSSQDLCWSTDNATLTLDGHSGELVKDATTGTWKLLNDDGTRITHLTSADGSADLCVNGTNTTSSGTHNGTLDINECWLVTTTDGTKYYFGMNQLPGWATGDPVTNSTWTVPVYDNVNGGPCYNATFSSAYCTMAWQWNLDYVVDVHGNQEVLYYNNETEKYDRDGSTSKVTTYVRGGSINHIDYGIEGNPYSSDAASDKVVFTYNADGRCVVTTGCSSEPIQGSVSSNPTHTTDYPDVPWDLNCTASTCGDMTSPSFWTDAELNSVSTEVWENIPAHASPTNFQYSTVDTWNLAHTFTNGVTKDATAPSLWLSSVTHTGTSGYFGTASGTTVTPLSVTEPPTTFTQIAMQNRVWSTDSPYTPLNQARIAQISTSVGAVIDVTYAQQDTHCTYANENAIVAAAATNSYRCFPEYWSKTPGGTLIADLFHKYVVQSVTENPETGGGADATKETDYDYSDGSPAWRFNSAAGVASKYRTWSDFAGFDKVRVSVGSPASPTLQKTTEYTFFQGMNGDATQKKAVAPATAVTVLSRNVDGAGSPADQPWFAGRVYKTQVYEGSGTTAPLLSTTVTTPWSYGPTASPTQTPGVPILQSAFMTGDAESVTTSPLSDGGTREVDTATTHSSDGYGLVTSVSTVSTDTNSAGTVTTPDVDPTCTSTSYAAANVSLWIIGLPSEISKVAVSCPNLSTATQAETISDTETAYDTYSLGLIGGRPTLGEPTETYELESYSGSTPYFVNTDTIHYDALGRQTSQATLVNSKTITTNTTSTAYTPASSGPLTGEVVTNNVSWNTSTKDIDPEWGSTVSDTDQNGALTSESYDGLGRLIAVWKSDRHKSTHPTSPSIAYVYTRSTTAANAIETITLGPSTNIVNYTLYDGLGRAIQTQSPAEGGGADVTDTAYDAAGNVSRTNNEYWTDSVSASGTLFVPTSESAVPSEVLSQYDGDNRITSSTLYSFGLVHSITATAYTGSDETDTTPPSGGTPKSVFVNSAGETTKLVQYLAPTVDPTAATESTVYTYDAQGNQISMTDPDDNTWTWSFNLLGQQISSTDPDTGATASTYDEAGDLLTTTDATGTTLEYQYDTLQRKTEEDQVNSGGQPNTELDSWSYDPGGSTGGELGQLASSTSYVGSTPGNPGSAYTETVTGYDAAYRALGQKISIPSTAPAFGSSTPYETDYTYNIAGLPSSTTYQAEGGLPAETVNTSYDAYGNASSLSTSTTSYTITTYNPLGEVQQQLRTGGSGSATAATAFGYDAATNAVAEIQTVSSYGGSSHVAEDNNYGYDADGNVTSIAMTSDSLAADTQCFAYDHLQNLTEAWTPSDGNCSEARSDSALAGTAPAYWNSYTVDPATGNRTTATRHGVGESGSDVESYYCYPTAGSPNPHAVQVIQSSACAEPTTPSYQYNADGETTQRPGQTITYDPEGRVAQVTEGTDSESYIYDADGNLLLQTDSSTGTTFFDGATELHVASGSNSISGQRIYSANGAAVAERSSDAGTSVSTLTWEVADSQGTVNLEINTSNGTLNYRTQDPFGNSRDSSPVTLADDRGYLNAPESAFSGLTLLGARMYDPATGRFLSVDSILDPNSPQQNNGYSYARNSPISSEDPTGLDPQAENCKAGCHYDTYGGITRLVAGAGANTVNGKVPPAGSGTAPSVPTPPGAGNKFQQYMSTHCVLGQDSNCSNSALAATDLQEDLCIIGEGPCQGSYTANFLLKGVRGAQKLSSVVCGGGGASMGIAGGDASACVVFFPSGPVGVANVGEFGIEEPLQDGGSLPGLNGFVGGGFTNAVNEKQLLGPFTTTTAQVGYGPLGLETQDSEGSNGVEVFVIGWAPALKGPELGYTIGTSDTLPLTPIAK